MKLFKFSLLVLILSIPYLPVLGQVSGEFELGLKVGNTTLSDNGNIRYTGTDFEGYTNGSWKSFTQQGVGTSPFVFDSTYNQIYNYSYTEAPKFYLYNYLDYGVLSFNLYDLGSSAPNQSSLNFKQYCHGYTGILPGDNTPITLSGASSIFSGAGSTKMLFGSLGPSPIHILTDGKTRIYGENGTGNIGLGTNSPQAKLHVYGNGGIFNLEGDEHAFMQFYPNGFAGGRKGLFGFKIANTSDLTIENEYTYGGIAFNTWSYSTPRMYISGEGDVGIGTTDPQDRLHVPGGNIQVGGPSGAHTKYGAATLQSYYSDGSHYDFRIQNFGGDLIIGGQSTNSTTSVVIGHSIPNENAILDIKSNSRGVLLPRMLTPEKNSIINPENGLLLYDKELQSFSYSVLGNWKEIATTDHIYWNIIGSELSNTNIGDVKLGSNTSNTDLTVIGKIRTSVDDTESDIIEITNTSDKAIVNAIGAQTIEFQHDGNTKMEIHSNGSVVFGDAPLVNDATAIVGGKLIAEEVKVSLKTGADWSDDEFDNTPPIEKMLEYIKKESHLLGMPSADYLVENGYDVTEMDSNLLKQSEWLWVNAGRQYRKHLSLKKEVVNLEDKVNSLEKEIKELKALIMSNK